MAPAKKGLIFPPTDPGASPVNFSVGGDLPATSYLLSCATHYEKEEIPMRDRLALLKVSLAVACSWASAVASVASAETLRIVTYNIKADTGSPGSDSGPGLTTVLQAIGSEHLNGGNAQPIDVLALQELYSTPSMTLGYIVGQLNGIYGAGTYAYDTTADPTTGGSGGGPSGLIYNTKTVRDVAAVAIGTDSDSGAPRAPMRYTLQPLGVAAAQFYLYVSHMKSGDAGDDSPTDGSRRNFEANELRTDAATLGANAHIIYSGDFNLDSSSEAAYQTLISSTLYSGIGQATDVQNGSWALGCLTESATKLEYRDDFQFVSGPMLSQNGLQLVPGTYGAFGNNGTTALGKSVDLTTNSALSDLTNRTDVLSALTTATDHLPIVADYTVVGVPEPSSGVLAGVAGLILVALSWRWFYPNTSRPTERPHP